MIADYQDSIEAATHLRSTKTVRERAASLLARARAGRSEYFHVHGASLDKAAALVATVTKERYPELKIPYHSRWRHFEAGGTDRLGSLNQQLGKISQAKRARAQIDLAIVSVLLDAGAGADWRYCDPRTGQVLSRSEGLGVASFNAFTKGLFSSKPTQPCQADAEGLSALTDRQLGEAFQVSVDNPLLGLGERAALLRRLGQVIAKQHDIFGGSGGQCRPGRLFDHLLGSSSVSSTIPNTNPSPTPDTNCSIAAHDILQVLLQSLSAIWPAQNALPCAQGEAIALGDCWLHLGVVVEPEFLGADAGWMPFHKLSQWLTYSLLEPFEWAGVHVTGLDALTGLPEYRNGGLLIDSGVLVLKDPANAQRPFEVGDALVVEWRALTVALLDELAPLVREKLGLSAEQMPLACVLEGGTWAAGRALAQTLRQGKPPLVINSDGTVF